jgi:hypothetical protein
MLINDNGWLCSTSEKLKQIYLLVQITRLPYSLACLQATLLSNSPNYQQPAKAEPTFFIPSSQSDSPDKFNTQACDATPGPQLDEVLWLSARQDPRSYTVEKYHQRGALRYLSSMTTSNAFHRDQECLAYFTAAPNQDLADYMGYFHSNDAKLNRILYTVGLINQPFPIIQKLSKFRGIHKSAVHYQPSLWECKPKITFILNQI